MKTGATSLLSPEAGRFRGAVWSEDGQSIEYQMERDGAVSIIQRRLDSAAETEIFRTAKLSGADILRVSPDRRFVGTVTPGTAATLLSVVSLRGEPAAEPLRVSMPTNWRVPYWQWLPDGDAVLVATQAPDRKKSELWRVSLSGRAQRLSIDTRQWIEGGHPRVSPDGRYIAFVGAAGDPGAEVWALENFLPERGSTVGAGKQ